MAEWTWDPERRQYRRTATGALVPAAVLLGLKSQFLAARERETERLAARLADGSLSAAGWEQEMRALIASTFTAMGLLGRGGVNAMTPQDVGPISAAIMHQYDYLGKFKGEVESGQVRATAVPARAALYLHAATHAYELGRAAAYGIDLPIYPGETTCLGNCRCHWEIEETATSFRATWVLAGDDENSCEECVDNASRWAPLVVTKSAEPLRARNPYS